ncbi:Eukaryotic translation initiation factor 3 subunit J [Lachnellula arida]|uniref:Eukaryotic translation initiation factor 3 subunit J n=1 Tax=Lachnellula arida TaxID=1316785 RepID=A0A8T9BAA0_9HELO|nr:Eukaryotic translation initiation factor 3 subunit J [Lachnellula arida]
MHSDEVFGLHLADRYSTEQMKKRTAARLPPRPRSLPLFDAASSMMKRPKIVLESWSAAEDSEVEREKAKVVAEKKAKADAEEKANKKSKAQRIAQKQAEKARRLAEESDDDSSEEDEAARRERLRRTEQESDLKHAEDLFGNIGISNSRKATTAANAVVVDAKNPSSTVDLTALPLFDPKTKLQFEKMRDTLVPVISSNAKKAQYVIFLQEFTKQLAKELPSDQIKKIASTLTALGNEKMKEEKAAEKGGKKSKAQKTKATLVANRNATGADVNAYDDDFGE